MDQQGAADVEAHEEATELRERVRELEGRLAKSTQSTFLDVHHRFRTPPVDSTSVEAEDIDIADFHASHREPLVAALEETEVMQPD